MHRLIRILTSLRLTVIALLLGLILVFIGTLAQVDLGLYAVQSRFFRSFFIYWTPQGTNVHIPVFPGGWSIGVLLLVNLLAAHIKRFKFTPKKYGIIMIHAGIIFLLVGQFLTEIFQVESTMRIEVGNTKNFAEAPRKVELALIDTTESDKDKVVVIPSSLLEKGGDIRTPELPFALRIEKYLPNSQLAGPMTPGEKIKADHGIGQKLEFSAAAQATGMNSEDNPSALVQVVTDKGPIGDWTVSTWMTRYPELDILRTNIGPMVGVNNATQPQTFNYNGRTWQIALRPVRYYKPYEIKLEEFHHDLYAGTEIPKNFSSKIHLHDSASGEDRDVLIYMNNPLRYHGETFYQASFEPDDRGTILQVVRNPASITPYAACSLVAAGLLTQFLMHLFNFARKRRHGDEPVKTHRPPSTPTVPPVHAAIKRSPR